MDRPEAHTTTGKSIIRCAGVCKAYRMGARAVPALRGVDLEIGEPGFYAVMGQSGSGKSTLLHLLAALDRPDAGEVFVAGRALHALDEREATAFRRRGVGIVFQQFNLIPTLTARENVELPGMLAGEDAGWLSKRSSELLERLGVAERAGHRPDALSGGEQQRVAIARAMLFSPRVLLADEPTGNLDSASAERLWGLLAELARAGAATVVMVTHEPAAAAHCRRVFVLRDGRVAGAFDVRRQEATERRPPGDEATEGENGPEARTTGQQSGDVVVDAAGVAARYQLLVAAS